MRVVALVPAHNEAERIGATVRAICSLPDLDRVVVVDDGSRDGTADIAEEAGAEVVRLDRNRGKGAALSAGLDAAHTADIVMLLDADLGETASQAGSLLGPLLAQEADMTIAGFPPADRPAGLGLVKGLARWGIRRLGGYFEASAPLSGQRALNGRALEAATPFESGYGVEVTLTIRALRAGLRVVEVPTTMSHAATGRDVAGFLHRGRQFVHVARALGRLAVERKPN